MGLTLQQVAEMVGGTLEGPPERVVASAAGIEGAEADQITFVSDAKYAKHLSGCAAAALVPADLDVPDGVDVVRTDRPEDAFEAVVRALHPEPGLPEGVHPTAVVADDARLGEGVCIGPHAVIGPAARIGERTTIHPGVQVGRGTSIGEDCVLFGNVVVGCACVLGDRIRIHPCSVIGSDGFGYRQVDGRHQKIPQVGNVVIEDDVEIGALTTINRARLDSTRIRRGVKIDCHVHVAHNCDIGEHSMLIGGTGLSGSVTLGKGVILAGGVSVTHHISIADGVVAMGRTNVSRSIKTPGEVMGGFIKGMPRKRFHRFQIALKKLPRLIERVARLEEKLRELESGAANA